MTRLTRTQRHQRRWGIASFVLLGIAAASFFMGGVSHDFQWGFWPTLGFWLGTFVSFWASCICLMIATEGC